MVKFGPLAAETISLVWDTAGNFNGFRVFAALLHGTLVVGVSQTLRRWTEGATYIRQGGHHVGHCPTFLVSSSLHPALVMLLVRYSILFDCKDRDYFDTVRGGQPNFHGRCVLEKATVKQNETLLVLFHWYGRHEGILRYGTQNPPKIIFSGNCHNVLAIFRKCFTSFPNRRLACKIHNVHSGIYITRRAYTNWQTHHLVCFLPCDAAMPVRSW